MGNRQIAIDIFLNAVESVKPDNLMSRFVSVNEDSLQIENQMINFSSTRNIFVVGAGKASAMMAQALEKILDNRITAGHIVTKYEHSIPLKYIGITEAGHPVPDENGLKGTGEVLKIVKNAGADDLVLCLISGGGSALLPDVPEGCSLEDVRVLNSLLLRCGANIKQMNCIRKHLSKVKGGMLAKAAHPAKVISLILSDVIGDPLDVIASGPTAPDPSTFDEAMSIIEEFGIINEIPDKILRILQEGKDKKRQETLKEDDEILLRTANLIIGSNKLALRIALEKAELSGYDTRIITNTLEGDVNDVAEYLMALIKREKTEHRNRKICLLLAGEPTVKVTGKGLGGRNQHLALIMAKMLKDFGDFTFLSGGTDGSDGPTDAAGAVVDDITLRNADMLGLDANHFIDNNDSYNFFRQEGGLIITGPTQTNVMDLIILLIN
jgi:glycerate 2-kinase